MKKKEKIKACGCLSDMLNKFLTAQLEAWKQFGALAMLVQHAATCLVGALSSFLQKIYWPPVPNNS